MPELFALAAINLPAHFEYSVRGHLDLPQATVELHDYRFCRPQRTKFEPARGFLDMALSHRPGTARGQYLGSPAHRSQPIGDVMFVPANHSLQSEWGAGTQRSICCAFGESGLAEDGWTSDVLESSLDIRNPFLRDALLRLTAELESPGFCSEIMAEALCIQVAIELGRYFRGIHSSRDEAHCRLRPGELRKIEELLEQPGKAPSIAALAAECGFSSRHFFRVFRATTGMTLSAFAAERRINRAKTLLTARKPPVKEIAWRCGFETPAAFSAAFRRATGMTPRAFRDQMAG